MQLNHYKQNFKQNKYTMHFFSIKKKDFTLTIYDELLSTIKNSNYKVFTINEYFSQKNYDKPFIILRHDVDRSPENSLKMSELESLYGIYSTYYFRVNNKTYIPDIIKKVKGLGHEIGYHYEVMDKAKGDFNKAKEIFSSELEKLRVLADINTVCMHGNPLSPWDNRSFWNKFSPEEFNLVGEAYLGINDKKLFYSTDTGRGWNRKKYNLKDTFSDSFIGYLPECFSTLELIDIIKKNKYKKIYLQVHPNRWNWNFVKWNIQLIEDIAANFIKLLIVSFRKKRKME